MADLETDIKIGADTSGVEAGITSAKRSLADLGVAATRATQAAQRALVEAQGYAKGSADSVEALARLRGKDTAAIQDQLNAARQLRSEAETLIAKQRETAAVSLFESQHQAAKKLVQDAEYVRYWTDSLDQMEAAERKTAGQNAFIDSLQRQSAAIGKTRADLLELQAAQLGIGDKAAPFIAQLRASEKGLGNVGVSAAQTAAALRGVPAQFTDIVTSLQGGQAPLTVFLQQGGQLKDMFGGAGNAAKALGGYVLGLIGPFTIAAAVVAGLTLAYAKGSQEQAEFTKAIVLSGNAAGVTVGQLNQYAQAIARVSGTQGNAAAALVEFAQSGKVGAENLQQFTLASVQFEKATGQAVSATVKQFAELAKSPLEATLKLNEQYGYLTSSVYAQIRALEQQGKTTEAADVAQKAFADTLANRSGQITGNLGDIEKGWNAIKRAITGAADALLGIGRASTNEDRLANVNAQINAFQKAQDAAKARASGAGAAERIDAAGAQRLASLKAEAAVLGGIIFTERERAAEQAKQNEQVKARASFDESGLKFLSDKKKLELEITAARNQGIAAGATEAQIEQRIADIRLSHNKTGAAGTVQDEVAQIKAATLAQQQYLKLLQEQGSEADKLTDGEKLVIKIKEQLKTSITGVARAQKEAALAAAVGLAAVEKQRQAEERKIKVDDASGDAFRKQIEDMGDAADKTDQQAQAQEAANKVFGLGKVAVEEYTLAQKKLQLQRLTDIGLAGGFTQELEAQIKAQERLIAALKTADFKSLYEKAQEYSRTVAEEAKVYADEAQLASLTGVERAKILAVRKVELEVAKRLAEVDKSSATDPEKKVARDLINTTAVQDKMIAVNKVVTDEWTKTADSINQSLTDALLRGFESGKTFAENLRDTVVNMFKTLVLRPIISAVVNPASQAISSAVGGSAGSGTGSLSNLASLGSSAYQALTGNSVVGSALSYAGVATGVGAAAGSAGVIAAGNAAYAGALAGGASAASAAASAGVAAGTAATGTGALAGGLSSAMAAIPVYGWVALAAAAIFSAVSGRGETRLGGQYDTTSGLLAAPSGGEIAGDAVKTTISATVSGINDLFKTLGSSTSVSYFNAGLESSKNGKGFTYAGGTLSDGTQFGNGFGTGYMNNRGSKTPEEAAAEFTVELQQSIVQALQVSSDIPDAIKAIVQGVDADKLDAAGVKAVLDQINAVVVSVQQFGAAAAGLPFDNLKNLSFNATSALLTVAGGLDALSSKLSSYYENFYTESERSANTVANLGTSFAALGLALPTTRDGFRDLVNAQDLTTDAGRQTYATLLGLADAFASIAPAATDAAAALAELNAQALKISTDNASAAYSALDRAVAAQKDSANLTLSLAQEQVSAIRSVFDTVAGSVKELYGEVGSATASQGAQGQALIVQALATAKATGYLPDSAELSDAIAAARAGINGADYGSQFEADRARLVLAGTLSQLQAVAGDQLTDAEKAVALAQEQVDSLAAMLTYAKQQLDAANGIDVSVRSVADALVEFNSSLKTLIATRAQQGLATLPGFASGGDHYGGLRIVGENGPEVEATGPARIWSADATRSMLGGKNEALLAEIRGLRDDNRAQALALYQVQQKLAKIADRWDTNGMPPEREEVTG